MASGHAARSQAGDWTCWRVVLNVALCTPPSLDTSHSVRLLWMGNQPIPETSTWQHTTLRRDRHPCPSGIWTHNVSKWVATDPYLRLQSHWDRPFWHLVNTKYSSGLSFTALLCNALNVCSFAVYGSPNWHTKKGLGVTIYNVRKCRLYESQMSVSRGPPVHFRSYDTSPKKEHSYL
jgi:hypothetical protein